MMKYGKITFFLFFLFTCFMPGLFGKITSVAGENELDLDKLAEAVQAQNGDIVEWSLHTREITGQLSDGMSVNQLKRSFPEWDWSMTQGKNSSHTIKGILRHGKLEESITVVKDPAASYVSYEIKGDIWNRSVSSSVKKLLSSRTGQIFGQQPVIFSCIKGVFNDRGELGQPHMKELLSSLQAKEKEALHEEGFDSVTAYSSLFSQALSLPGEEMNLQIGLRSSNSGLGTYFTIGTPILINEY
ncbi:YwmB family TATA-box binding protein [Siminovitchia sediminis]|uniref:YwmB family TATA-box binding protein n=1 Tax=Siminovitchia sediminis TaxID=1274353 RepID=A0ABW4KKS9_9BACI